MRQSSLARPVRGACPDLRAGLSRRAYYRKTTSRRWALIWEAGPYYERVASTLERARSYAIFVGWQIDSRLELSTARHEGFKDFLIRMCREKPQLHLYFLMWDFAMFYVFERELMQEWVWSNLHERIHFVFDNHHPWGGSHHEKLVVIDGETAFVGGVDICDDRWDTPQHPYNDKRRSLRHDREGHMPYHDMSVEVRGEVAAELVEYARERWQEVSSVPFPKRPRSGQDGGPGSYGVLISRTRAKVGSGRPLLVRETEFLFRELIRSAKREVIIEQQYYWSQTLNDELIALMESRKGLDLKIFIVVPPGHRGSTAFRMMGVLQTRLLDQLSAAARETGTTLVLGCPFSRSAFGTSRKPVYVHSKLLVIDDAYMAVGSANFNNRGFRLDTELTLTILGENDESRARIKEQARRVVAHWGEHGYSRFYGEPRGRAARRGVELEDYHASWDECLGSFAAILSRALPLASMLDPNKPIGYALKSRVTSTRSPRLRRLLPVAALAAMSLATGLSLLLLSVFSRSAGSGLSPEQARWTAIYALWLSNAWLLRAPVVLGCVCAGLQLGAGLAAPLAASSLAVAMGFSYAFGRLMPKGAMRYYAAMTPSWFRKMIGLRRFFAVLWAALQPWVPLQARFASLGVFSIPIRWACVVAAPLLFLYWAMSRLSGEWGGAHGSSELGTWSSAVFIVCSLVATLRGVRRLSRE